MTSTELGPLSTKSPLKSSTRQSQGFECKNGRITPIYICMTLYIYLVIHTFTYRVYIHVAMFQYTSFPGFPHCIMVFKYTFKRHTFKGYVHTVRSQHIKGELFGF